MKSRVVSSGAGCVVMLSMYDGSRRGTLDRAAVTLQARPRVS
jgi:hypothetical protein